MADAGERTDEWVSVSRAAELSGIPKRTLYACIERRELAVRDVQGVSHVHVDALQALVGRRRGSAGETDVIALHSAAAAQGGVSAQQPEVVAARARVEQRRLEAEELKAAEGVREVREELADAEAFRSGRRLREELAAERERLELEQAAWRLQRERADAERAARSKVRQREAQIERERADAADASARRDAEIAAQRWANRVADQVANWARDEFGPRAVAPARDAALRVLRGRGPSEAGPELGRIIYAEVDAALVEFSELRQATQEQFEREEMVSRVMWRYVVHSPAADVPRIRAAAEREVALIRVGASDAEQRVRDAAKAEYDAIEREHAERSRARSLQRDADRWAEAYAEIPRLVARELPQSSTDEERAFAVRELQNLVNARPPQLQSWRYEEMAKELLAPLAARARSR